ncbi:MAG TPA: zf-TFIIB domain-containing protein, partial [Dehalococcoidia bacterium]|nr:zf-TFIIB domain-containing protein [Dehalococcoidia bacterium]
LEDEKYDEDELKGSLVFSETASGAPCPVCTITLIQFNYRLNDLWLEYCISGHGYWLDAGEDDRVLVAMQQRESAMERKGDAEAGWADTLRRMRSPSFADKVKNLFGGRGGGGGAPA